MDQIYSKIERYLKREFPGCQIVKLKNKQTVDLDMAEYYGTGGMLIAIYPVENKVVYYKFSGKK